LSDPNSKTALDFAGHLRTNPFLRDLMETFVKVGGNMGRGGAAIDFDELGVGEVVELLDSPDTHMDAVLADFGDRNPQEDPVIHFYEHFLAAYDKKQKVSRGVFYTPRPVVSYIVRSVDELLRSEFGLADGLADTSTWGEMLKRNKDLRIPEGVSTEQGFVQILDPATGTGTFLVEVIDTIHKTLLAKWKGKSAKDIDRLWNEYVPSQLLPRLHGYELLMAPYAIAHLKVGLKLHETGYRFESEERARIYLTNALEPATDLKQGRLEAMLPALAHEAEAVNEVKRKRRFTVVVGNPPYSAISSNLTPENRRIVDEYRSVHGVPIKERSMLQFEKNIQDDYIKFFAISQRQVTKASAGIVSLVTNHSFLDGPTLRGMRSSLMDCFDSLDFFDLHGNVNKKENRYNIDENVFEIQQGVAISFLRKSISDMAKAFCLGQFSGSRQMKYDALATSTLQTTARTRCDPQPESYLFLAFDSPTSDEYSMFVPLERVLVKNLMGTKTGFNELLIDFDRDALIEKIGSFGDQNVQEAELSAKYDIKSGHSALVLERRLGLTKGDWAKYAKPFQAFPFDYRWAFLRKEFLQGHRFGVMENLKRGRPGLVAMRQTKEMFGVFVVGGFCGHKLLGSYDTNNVFPVFDLSLEGQTFIDWRVFRNSSILLTISIEDSTLLFRYIYSIFQSPTYRSRYAEFLKIEFPRLPLPGSLPLFRELAALGEELVAVHLLESPTVEDFITEYTGQRAPEVEKVSWSDETVWIDKAQSIGFKGVREEVWNFHIGGYQVCEKWLKDRKGRKLLAEDVRHYQRVVVALKETIRLMAEIDVVIERHGGWPGAFSTGPVAGSAGTATAESPARGYGEEAAESEPRYGE
ncbi:MAG: type ISP restriction/modification enzyme, partial [Spirochaetota bacterium]